MQATGNTLTIPQIRGFLAVRSGLTVQTAADETGLECGELVDVLARIRRAHAVTPRGKTRR